MKDYILALLILLPTYVLIPQAVIYIIISLIGTVYFLNDVRNNKIIKTDIALLIFILFSTIVYYLLPPVVDYSNQAKSLNDVVPYTLFILSTIFFSRHLNDGVWRVILYFIVIETLVGVFEYAVGKPFLINPGLNSETQFGDTDFLYFNRVLGLSASNSIFSQKIMVGILLYFYLNLKTISKYFIIILLVGLFISFNRTAIFTVICFMGINYLYNFSNVRYKLFFFALLCAILSFGWYKIDYLLSQFNRGKSNTDMSGRDELFPYYLNFIENNLLFGNNGHKLFNTVLGDLNHAHNSYLQTLSNIGLILFIILFAYLYLNFNKKNFIYLFPLLFYSVFQYGILWGTSFLDIVFFYFLFNIVSSKKGKKSYKQEVAL